MEMKEQFRENYFLAVRTGLLLALEVYIALSQSMLDGESAGVLFLLALLAGAVTGRELVNQKKRWILSGLSVLIWLFLVLLLGRQFLMLGILLYYEGVSYVKPGILWYLAPFTAAWIPGGTDISVQIMFTVFLGVIYFQHDYVIESYRRQTKEDTLSEQDLKRNMYEKEHEMKQEIRRGLLMAENQVLEERTQLSQTLHDRLGHNINGSVYQLEAIKVLMDKEPETAKKNDSGGY